MELCLYILFALWVYFVCRARAEKHTAHIQGLKTHCVGMVHILPFSVSNSFKEQQALVFRSFDAHQPLVDKHSKHQEMIEITLFLFTNAYCNNCKQFAFQLLSNL